MRYHAERTAMARKRASKPVQALLDMGFLSGPVLDYGCGRGKDVEVLNARGIKAYGYDPHYFPKFPRRKSYPEVLLLYVLNVLDPTDRLDVLRQAFSHVKPGGCLFVATRPPSCVLEHMRRSKRGWKAAFDGYITESGTFQCGLSVEDVFKLVQYLPDAKSCIQYLPKTAFGDVCLSIGKHRMSRRLTY